MPASEVQLNDTKSVTNIFVLGLQLAVFLGELDAHGGQ